MKHVEIKEGDILIINTGTIDMPGIRKKCDEIRYFVKHPHQHQSLMNGRWI